MNKNIERIRQTIEPLREAIINHKVYGVINDTRNLTTFMEYHVFAVWDFMSLLKALQNNLTCTSVPWFPKGSAETRFLINEIVVGEESDVDYFGNRKSHFEIYLDAMQQCGADTTTIATFTHTLKETGDLQKAFDMANLPAEVQQFVGFTFDTIYSNKAHLQSAVFTFGREDLIPGMFHSIVNDIDKKSPDSISIFKYYLERHIEVDGGHHSALALQMTSNCCEANEQYWAEAEQAVVASLQRRIALWDGVYEKIMADRQRTATDFASRYIQV